MAKNTLKFPFFTADFSFPLPQEELVLATGGRSPRQEWLLKLVQDRRLWCIDHGLDYCYAANLLPERLIGDGDSAHTKAWNWAREQKVKIDQFPPEKDYTDTQLALHMAAKENASVILTGPFGGRLDHAFSTAFSFAYSPLQGLLIDDKEALIFIKDYQSVSLDFLVQPKVLSLLAFTEEAHCVNINNVKWPLINKDLKQGFPYSVSNEVKENPVHISVKNGILGVYICWDFI